MVLVDRERAVPRLDDAKRIAIALVELDRHDLEQVLEVDVAVGLLPPLVVAEDALHELRGDRRFVLAEAVEYVSGVSRRFFAHSTSVARSTAGVNLYGIGSELPIQRSGGAFEASTLSSLIFPKKRSCASAASGTSRRGRAPPSRASRARASRLRPCR